MLLIPLLIAGCDSPLSVEQHVWCAANGDQVQVFRAAIEEARAEGWTGHIVIEGARRDPTVDEMACFEAYQKADPPN